MPPSEIQSVLVQRQGGTKSLHISRNRIICRAIQETKPKRIHTLKLAATLIRQTSRRNTGDAVRADIFSEELLSQSHDLERILPEYDPVSVHASSYSSLLERLMILTTPTVFVGMGEMRAPRDDSQVSVANILDGIDRMHRESALRRLLGAATSREGEMAGGPSLQDVLSVQERPGKMSSLASDDATAKLMQKRIAADLANFTGRRDQEPAQAFAVDGWGAGSLWLAPGDGNPKAVNLASAKLKMGSEFYTLETTPKIVERTLAWFQEVSGADIGDIQAVLISTPHVSIAGQFIRCLAEASAKKIDASKCLLPDLVFGWNPLLSLFSLLSSGTKPSLAIIVDRFPSVELVALWR